jgi:O-antigen/teichoic acid export membrane protein
MMRAAILSATAIKALSIVLGLVTASVFSSALGEKDYGKFLYWVSILMVFSTFISGGAPRLVTRFTLKYSVSRRASRMSYLLSFFYGRILFVGSLLMIVYCALLGNTSSIAVVLPDFIWLLIFSPLVAFCNISASYLKGVNRPIQAAIPNMLLQSTLLIVAYFVVSTFITFDLNQMMTIYVLSIAAAALCYFVFTSRCTSLFLNNRFMITKNVWTRTLPDFYATTVFSTLNLHISALVLGFFLSPEYTAHFRIAEKMILCVGLPLIIINMMIGPRLSLAIENKDSRFIFRLMFVTGFASCGAFVLTYILVENVFDRVFAKDVYSGAKEIVYWLALTPLINNIFGPLGYALQVAGKEAVVRNSQILSMVISCSVAISTVPFFGVYGAVIAAVLSMLGCQLYLLYFFLKYIGEINYGRF